MHQRKPVIAYYITPHGFGHAVRSLEIVRCLLNLKPNIEVLLITDIPASLVEENTGRELKMRKTRLDIGLYQYDSIRFDLGKTLSALLDLKSQSGRIIREESAFLKEQRIDAVICDIPFLPFHAAHDCGIPAIGISNFTWDWIYESYEGSDPRWGDIRSWVREYYAMCGLFLQLPMHGDCSACPVIEDSPLVARVSGRNRSEVRRLLGLDPHRKVFLAAFTTLEMNERALRRIEEIRDVTFLYKSPMEFPVSNALSIDGTGISYVDAVAAADSVITKPGYGIVSDCLAHGTPVIYTDRGPFPEYPILVDGIRENLPSVFLDPGDLYRGNWEEAIGQILSMTRNSPPIDAPGADFCARRIGDFL